MHPEIELGEDDEAMELLQRQLAHERAWFEGERDAFHRAAQWFASAQQRYDTVVPRLERAIDLLRRGPEILASVRGTPEWEAAGGDIAEEAARRGFREVP